MPNNTSRTFVQGRMFNVSWEVPSHSLRWQILNKLALCVQEGWTPLHVAVQGGRVDIIKLLISRGADITIQNKVFLSLTTLLFLCSELVFI